VTAKITVDGAGIKASPGQTILGACAAAGVDIPTLCFGPTLEPKNACRICMVEVEGSRVLVPACSRQAEDGMVVHTDSARVRHARRMVLELLASTADLERSDDAMRWMGEYGADPDRHGGREPVDVKVDNELYVRDYDRCILCYKCVDACGEQWQGTFAIAMAGRGHRAHISTEWDAALPESACVFCGNCIAVCPTGALVPTTEHELGAADEWRPEEQSQTTTVCSFCGVGCNLTLHVQDGRIVKVSSPDDHDITRGNLCIKGRFGWTHVQ
jgi:NADH dehydrogenase/NADH:ubiquinone oxidoreductase subunit G